MQNSTLPDDPLWFKDAIIYEVPVRAFADSNGDGIGDFRGLTGKLDYLQDLGVTAVWLLPFFPSPLKDDGYDIADYNSVNPIYGTLEDFKAFLDAAHQRGIRVIVELIVNHTSDQHPWFQRARWAPKGSRERDFYVWSDTPEKYRDARIIFQDFETANWAWDAVAKAYYWHRFYSHQPDLNYDNPAVRQAIAEVLDFWLHLGVDGFRMDAVPYLYEREGTNCENLLETHAFLKQLRRQVDEKYPNRMLLAEANQWPEDAAQYYGDGDECHMNFHFPLMPRLFMALRMEDSFPIVDILQQTPAIPDNCQWALFLRNHDELTLEMVTDEDRDYMYRVYAQDPEMRLNLGIRRRLAPLLGNDRRQIELLNSLLLSLPGTPVLYYGDEIGMGDNVYVGDRNGVRTPMQWSADRNAGFSRANPHRLYLPVIVESEYHYEAINVEVQRGNPNSLWNWMKRLIATRNRFQALGRGSFELLHPENRKVLAFTRTYDNAHILVVANLSRFVQIVELDLSAFTDMVPTEIFGRTEFLPISELPYFLSLSPYGVYWFTLKLKPGSLPAPKSQAELPQLAMGGQWQNIFFQRLQKEALESILLDYLHTSRWFGGRTKSVQSTQIIEAIPVPYTDPFAHLGSPYKKSVEDGSGDFAPAPTFNEKFTARLVCLRADFVQGDPETYLLPLAYAEGERATQLLKEMPQAVIAQLQLLPEGQSSIGNRQWQEATTDPLPMPPETTGILFDAIADQNFLILLLDVIAHQRSFKGMAGELIAVATDVFSQVTTTSALEPALLKGEHRHIVLVYSDVSGGSAAQQRFLLKLFSKVEEGINPDLEIGSFLKERQRMEHVPAIAGWLEYRRSAEGQGPAPEPMILGLLQEYIADTRNTWDYTLDSLRHYFEQVMTQQGAITEIPAPISFRVPMSPHPGASPFSETPLQPQDPAFPKLLATQLIGTYFSNAQLLGQRTAELHLALASNLDNPNFAPEPFTSFYQRSIYQYARNLTGQTLLLLKNRLNTLSPHVLKLAQAVLNRKDEYLERFQLILNHKITALRTRCHGNYHLGQVLYTGKDFVLIDFEGDPTQRLGERRIKRSPLRDVASMLHSFHYATQIALHREIESGMIRAETLPLMERWAQFWYGWVSAAFLHAYLATASQGSFLPQTPQELDVLLDAYGLEKAIDELGYTLNHRPDWVEMPLQRLVQLLDTSNNSD
jgi:maltose alpha-D-glucosyltransferase/alpha-amylase